MSTKAIPEIAHLWKVRAEELGGAGTLIMWPWLAKNPFSNSSAPMTASPVYILREIRAECQACQVHVVLLTLT